MSKGDAKEMAGQRASGRHGREKSKTVPTSAIAYKSPRLARGQVPAATGAVAHLQHPPHGSLHVRTSRIVLMFRRDPPNGVIERCFEGDVPLVEPHSMRSVSGPPPGKGSMLGGKQQLEGRSQFAILMIWNAAIYCTLVVRDSLIVSLR